MWFQLFLINGIITKIKDKIMDFKAIINKIASMDDAIDTVKSPELPKAVQLNEDAELRVLSGRTTYVAEAKKKAEEEKVDENAFTDNSKGSEMRVGDKKKSSTGGTIEKTKTGIKHTAGKNYGGSTDDEAKSKKVKESAKPDFLDIDGDGDKKEPMKKAAADKKKAGDKKDAPAAKKGMTDKQAKYFGKKKDVKEAEEKRAPAKKAERDVELPSGAKVKATKVQGWQSQKADKEAKKDESVSKDVKRAAKKNIGESVEQKLTFKDCVRIVQESGGQQQIDAVDKELFAWATRVAKQKLGESTKAELYAGMVYERMGGAFNMYNVLSEDQK